MGRNIFVSDAKVPPTRWRQAFPQAEIIGDIPAGQLQDAVIWLHNPLPAQLARRPEGVRFVVMHDEPSDEKGLQALAQGAAGYCNSHSTPELLQTIESVIRNQGLWVGESLLNRLIGGINLRSTVAGRQQESQALRLLSGREREVALCVARGESNKEIARQFDLAERTIKAHLTGIFEKLGVRDRLQLALLLNTQE